MLRVGGLTNIRLMGLLVGLTPRAVRAAGTQSVQRETRALLAGTEFP